MAPPGRAEGAGGEPQAWHLQPQAEARNVAQQYPVESL